MPTTHHPSSPFAEHFKYDVISSSLLSTSLPVPHHGRQLPSPTLPGKLKLDCDNSRSSSRELGSPHASTTSHPVSSPPYHHWLPYFIFPAIFGAGYYLLAFLLLGGMLALVYISHIPDSAKHGPMTPVRQLVLSLFGPR